MTNNFWTANRFLVTGGDGFIGRVLVKRLLEKGTDVFVQKIQDYDLRKEEDVKRLFEESKPEIIIHLAANVGSTSYIKEHAAEVYYDNIMMNTLVLEYSKIYGARKFVGLGSAFEYALDTSASFKEQDLSEGIGNLEPDSSAYSIPKKLMLLQSRLYKEKYNFNAIHVLMTSVYGPFQNPNAPILAMTKRFIDARDNGRESVEIWGTGEATRDFIYLDDAVEGILRCTESYDSSMPINIGSGKETKIRELAEMIKDIVGYKGKLIFDASKPEGLKRVFLEGSRAERELGFRARVGLKEGLRRIVESLS